MYAQSSLVRTYVWLEVSRLRVKMGKANNRSNIHIECTNYLMEYYTNQRSYTSIVRLNLNNIVAVIETSRKQICRYNGIIQYINSQVLVEMRIDCSVRSLLTPNTLI